MREAIGRLRSKRELDLTDKNDSWEIRIIRPDDLLFEIVVPKEVFEWFVAAKQASTNRELWSDWMDYYSADRADNTDLHSEMKRDVERFIERLLASEVRFFDSRTFFGRKRLEWRSDKNWEKFSLI